MIINILYLKLYQKVILRNGNNIMVKYGGYYLLNMMRLILR